MHGTDISDILTDPRYLLPAAGILLLLSMVVAVQRPVSQEIARYPMEVQVTHTNVDEISLGLSTDDDRIDFGELPAGAMTAERSVDIANNEDRSVAAHTRKTGNISRYVQVAPDAVSLPASGTQTVTISIETTNTTAPGHYSGALVVEETQPFWRWLWSR